MPVHGNDAEGYRWGSQGKLYKGKGAKEKAAAQGRAAYANGYRPKSGLAKLMTTTTE